MKETAVRGIHSLVGVGDDSCLRRSTAAMWRGGKELKGRVRHWGVELYEAPVAATSEIEALFTTKF